MDVMKRLFSIMKVLQSEDITLHDARYLFDKVLDDYGETFPDLYVHLDKFANIVRYPDFENGIVKLLRGGGGNAAASNPLTPEETYSVECFSQEVVDLVNEENMNDNALDQEKEIGYGHSLLKKARKESHLSESCYMNLTWIPPTTCALERLFSQCKHALTELRTRMTPLRFEAIMIL
jgi:hypothetical protein